MPRKPNATVEEKRKEDWERQRKQNLTAEQLEKIREKKENTHVCKEVKFPSHL